jgi:hypothetical protein
MPGGDDVAATAVMFDDVVLIKRGGDMHDEELTGGRKEDGKGL